MFSQLTSVIEQWHCVTLGGYRGQSGDDLNAKLTSVYPSAKSVSEDSVVEGVQSAVKNADKNDIVLVFGSFHTVGGIFRIFSIMGLQTKKADKMSAFLFHVLLVKRFNNA